MQIVCAQPNLLSVFETLLTGVIDKLQLVASRGRHLDTVPAVPALKVACRPIRQTSGTQVSIVFFLLIYTENIDGKNKAEPRSGKTETSAFA